MSPSDAEASFIELQLGNFSRNHSSLTAYLSKTFGYEGRCVIFSPIPHFKCTCNNAISHAVHASLRLALHTCRPVTLFALLDFPGVLILSQTFPGVLLILDEPSTPIKQQSYMMAHVVHNLLNSRCIALLPCDR